MTRRILWMLGITALACVAFYISRYWPFTLWGREGLFGIQSLRPQGGLLALWLRGTPLAAFELLIWVMGCFLVLTWVQKLYDMTAPASD